MLNEYVIYTYLFENLTFLLEKCIGRSKCYIDWRVDVKCFEYVTSNYVIINHSPLQHHP